MSSRARSNKPKKPTPPAAAKKETVPELINQAAQLRKAANDTLGEQEYIGVPDDVEHDDAGQDKQNRPITRPGATVTEDALRAALKDAEQVLHQAERAKKRYTDEYLRLADSKEQLAAERTALHDEKKEISNAKRALAEQRASLDKRESDLADQRDEAESGFAALREARLGKLETELDELRMKWEAGRAARLDEFEQRLTNREKEANERIAESERKLTEREQRINTIEEGLLERERVIRRAEITAQAHADVLRQQEHDIRTDLEQSFHRRITELTFQADDWKSKFEAVDKVSRQRQKELNDIRSAYLNVGSPQLAQETIGQLQIEVQELRRASYEDTPLLRERHDYLERRVGELEAERSDVVQRNAELMRAAELNRISVAERETNRLITESLNSRYALLKTEHEALRLEVDQYQERQEGQSPFQQCSLMDNNKEFQVSPKFPVSAPQLADLVHRTSQLIAAKGRYFSAHDLRCFVGGLAMSRLHLLQGISGIGKTSLPRDFAAAINAECVVVPVAAEWRSPQDLMGYYNPFERRFYESAFTKALYKAQQPLYANKPFLIVLDEMNLSHPEQYFSDVLHALELPPSGEPQRLVLELMSGRVDPAPRLFEDGYKLVIPDNVWFIGTANQDETTVAFADKTYDRAHITELPARPIRFTAKTVEPIRPFSTRALDTRFTDAQTTYQDEVDLVKGFLEALSDFTREAFGFTTAPRLLDRQLEKFVPVVIAAGGSPAEAADHLAATKLLRKLHGRVEIGKDRLKPMLDRLNDEWHIFDVDSVSDDFDVDSVSDDAEKWPSPKESLAVIDNEIRDRSGW